jgi:hypothetical protein
MPPAVRCERATVALILAVALVALVAFVALALLVHVSAWVSIVLPRCS